MSAIVYADFTCPACYLASLRVDGLIAAGGPVPDWRAVEHRPRLPRAGIHLQTSARNTRAAEVGTVRALLQGGETFPATVPRFLPHPAAAAAAYAEAYGAGVADLVRPLLFHAYWVDGKDIGDPEVLRRLLPPAFAQGRRTSDPIRDFGYAVTSQHGPITTQAYRRMRRWQEEWLELGGSVALTLATRLDTLVGPNALRQLAISPSRRPRPATAPRPRSAGPTLVSKP
ncbi:MAG TPA: hypothetical protein VFJ14_04845 [Nocardioidaceae bacterium]|nr:hypothetical protein [Nocardioidaceae bacterium]